MSLLPSLMWLSLGCLSASDDPGLELPECEEWCVDHDFGTVQLDPYSEITDLCLSWTVGNQQSLWVNQVAVENDGWFHHSNWFWVPDDLWGLPDGGWDCSDEHFTELGAAVAGGVVYAQSTQVTVETQAFVPGAAIEVPPYSRIIAFSHLLNWTEDTVETGLRVQLHTLPEEQVDARLAPFRLTYFDIDLPAGTRTKHGTRCDVAALHEDLTGEPLDLRLHYVLPHFHDYGVGFELGLVGGERDGETIYALDAEFGHALGHTFDTPVDLVENGATGFSFDCLHDNTGDEDLVWGNGAGEMCMMLGFAETGIAFDGNVRQTTATSESADGELTRTGDCDIDGIRFGDLD